MRSRQIFVTVAALICAVGAMFGSGLIGTPIDQASGGAFSEGSSYIAPLGPAFAIWGVVYLGLLLYTIRQWRPQMADTRRHRNTAGLAALVMIFQASWLFAVQLGSVVGALIAVLLLAATNAVMMQRLLTYPARGAVERIVTDGTFGLLLGWLCVAVWFSVFGLAYTTGRYLLGFWGTLLTVVTLGIVVIVSVLLARHFGGNLAITTGTTWALAWIAAARFQGPTTSILVGIVAGLAAVTVLVAGLVERRRATESASPARPPDQSTHSAI